MIAVLIIGGLAVVVGLLILHPSFSARGYRHIRTRTSNEVRYRELLRQLRDLDDDLAAGKLTDVDHVLLRRPVEREAAAVLRRIKTQGRAAGSGDVTSGAGSGSTDSSPPRGRDAAAGARRWRRRTVVVLAFAAGMVSVTILLVNATSPRSAQQSISGDLAAGTATSGGSRSDGAPSSDAGQQSATPGQLAAIDAMVARVKQDPKDVGGHLALANAYAAAGASQLAAMEYLAVTQLDPANAEANTYLALLAFQVGQAAQGKSMVDRVLAAHPEYPEALYVRGLILLMGLHQPQAAEADLNAYLAVAPFGSYRTAVETLLVLADTQDQQ
ncbi:tetratricopeptide repeat protein [Micromonospora sp. NPDC005806]|uniref:tetratricopeptide repeat protein n=1 Tax=Micromonospora sp. NPDC005806 TaxID=3364234 RepID=UPI003696A4C5